MREKERARGREGEREREREIEREEGGIWETGWREAGSVVLRSVVLLVSKFSIIDLSFFSRFYAERIYL